MVENRYTVLIPGMNVTQVPLSRAPADGTAVRPTSFDCSGRAGQSVRTEQRAVAAAIRPQLCKPGVWEAMDDAEHRHQPEGQAVATYVRGDDLGQPAPLADDGGATDERSRQQARLDDLAADTRDRAAEMRRDRATRASHAIHHDNAMLREFWANRRPAGT
jgi:hypothetical protein